MTFLIGFAKDAPEATPCFFVPLGECIYSTAEKEHRNSVRTNEIRICRKMAAQVAIVTNRKRPATCLEVHGHVIASIYLFRNNNGSAHPEYANRVRRFGPFRWLLLMDFDKQYRMNYRVYMKYRYVYNYVKSESNTRYWDKRDLYMTGTRIKCKSLFVFGTFNFGMIDSNETSL